MTAYLAPNSSEGNPGPIILVGLVSWISLSFLLSVFARSTEGIVIVSVVALPLSYFYMSLSLSVLYENVLKNPPPRPLFRNFLAHDERVLLPYWYPAIPSLDLNDVIYWTDNKKNMLVIILASDEFKSSGGLGLTSTPTTAKFSLNTSEGELKRTLRPAKNQLTIFTGADETFTFSMRSGTANKLAESNSPHATTDLFQFLESRIVAVDKSSYAEFLSRTSDIRSIKEVASGVNE